MSAGPSPLRTLVAEAPRHVLDEPRLAAAGRPLEQHGQASGERRGEHLDLVADRQIPRGVAGRAWFHGGDHRRAHVRGATRVRTPSSCPSEPARSGRFRRTVRRVLLSCRRRWPRRPSSCPALIHGIIARRRRADELDRVVLALLLEALVVRPAGLALGDPLVGELAVLDLVEDAPHLGAGLVGDDARAAGEVAVLGGVGDRVAHAGDPLLVHQVDDQLHLVEALEVRHLRRVAGRR